MVLLDRLGAAENRPDAQRMKEQLAQLDPYIVALAGRCAPRLSVNPEAMALEVDDIVQSVRIKFWRMLERSDIINPRAYIKSMVHSAVIDTTRRYKHTLPLPVDEDGELYTGEVVATQSSGMMDPAYELEQQEALIDLTVRVVEAVLKLPPHQRQAMIWTIRHSDADTPLLRKMFLERGLDVETMNMPEDAKGMQRLRASLYAARKKLGPHMSILQPEEVQRDMSNTAPADDHTLSSPGRYEGEVQGEGVKCIAEMKTYIDELREPYQTVIRHRYVKKHTYQQIAEKLNLPIGTVKSHVNRGMKRLRKLLEQKGMGHDSNEGSEMMHKTDIAEIAARVKTLDEPYRTAVELHYVKKYTCQQIADELNLPKGTVKSHISRGMEKLRRSA